MLYVWYTQYLSGCYPSSRQKITIFSPKISQTDPGTQLSLQDRRHENPWIEKIIFELSFIDKKLMKLCL